MIHTQPSAVRPALGFSFHGLSPRDETLFKSYLRLLDHRTAQHWEHHQDRADVRVVAEGSVEATTDAASTSRWQLTIGTTEKQQQHFVSLPFKADQLESELNLLGALVMQVRNALSMKPQPRDDMLRLSRWPNPALLRSAERLRLATCMTGRPFSPATLSTRTGIAAAVCESFVTDLRQAGLLESANGAAATQPVQQNRTPASVAPDAPQAQRPAVPVGLLARIRNRLGISNLSLS